MKCKKRILSLVTALLLTVFCTAATVFAGTFSRDGIEAVITTDKDSYSYGEKIEAEITITNTNSYKVNKVAWETIIPDGFYLVDESVEVIDLGDLEAGESRTFTVKLSSDPRDQGTDNGQSGGNNGGNTSGGNTSGGNTSGGNTSGGNTSGGNSGSNNGGTTTRPGNTSGSSGSNTSGTTTRPGNTGSNTSGTTTRPGNTGSNTSGTVTRPATSGNNTSGTVTRPATSGNNTNGTTTRPATGNNSGNNNSGNTGKIIYSNTANNGTNSGNSNASSGNNGKVTFNNLGKTPSTGDHKNIVIWGIVLTISVILLVAVVYAYMNNKKKAAKRRKNRQRNNDMFYSLFLVLTISLGLVFGNNRVVNAAPRQTEDRTITVVSTVSVDGDKVVVEGCVYYEKEVQPETPEPDHGNINVDVDGSFTIEYFYADTNDILVGDSAQVTFFAKINSQFMITDPVTVMDDQGNAAAYLNDEGTDGDEVAGDGIFTGTGTIGSDQRGFAYFHAECLDAASETCSIYFYTEITAADYDRTTEIIEALNACETIEDALKYLDEQTDIEGYEEAEDHSAILLRTQWGITIDWTPHQETEATDAASMVKAPTTDEYGSIIASSGGNSYNSLANQLGNLDLEAANDKTDVCVVRPFRHNGFEYDDFLDCGNLIANEFGSSVVNFDDNAATMDAFKSFGQYGSVLIDSHGNLSNVTNSAWTIMDKDPYILTGETMGSWESFVSADWESERIIVIANDGSLFGGFMGGGIVAVGAGFFDKYYNPGDLDECMFFLGTCYSLYNNTIADALISKGAEVVYGFTDVVSVDYCNDCLVECVGNNLLVYHTTADEAFNTTVAVCGATDSRNANTRFEHAGAGGYKLVSSNGQIAGSVAAYDTGSPLVNATVTYTNQETGAVKTSYSNADGSFGRKLEEGNYTVEVSAYGYLTEVIEDIEINVGQTTYLEASVMLHPVTDSIITGMITDATNACPIENAEIRFRLNHNNKSGNTLAYEDGAEVVVTTNAEGYYEFDKLPGGYYTMEVQADNYVTTYRNIIATGDGISQDAALSPILGDSELRIVLTWGENPRDLDSHLVGPKANGDGNFHIYYSNKTYSAGDTLYADLDLDDVDSYGPETTTLHETSNGMYYFYVHHFAGSQHISTSGAQVKVYKDDQLVATYNAPTDQGNDIYWNVFTYDPSTGSITTVNTITNRPVTD